jgi:hypothetical protein
MVIDIVVPETAEVESVEISIAANGFTLSFSTYT